MQVGIKIISLRVYLQGHMILARSDDRKWRTILFWCTRTAL